jgi:uncharacterized protein
VNRPVIVRSALIGLIVLSGVPAAAQDPVAAPPNQPLIVVSGEGIVRATPDRAFVVIAAESRAKNPGDAQKQNATAMTAVQDRLRQTGIPRDAIRTLGYDLQPEFDYVNGRQSLRGYVARNSIEVTVDNLDRVGSIVDVSVGAGATSVQSLRFDLKSRDVAEREALRLAVADARARADAAAAGAGQRVERIWRIEESRGFVPRPPQPLVMREAASAVPTPIVAGEVEVRAQVTLSAVMR